MSNKAQAFAALNTFADSRVALIQGLKDAGYHTVEQCKPIVIEWACDKTGAEFRTTEAGKVLLVSSHKRYEAAKTTVRDTKETDPLQTLADKLAKLSKADQRKVLKLAGL